MFSSKLPVIAVIRCSECKLKYLLPANFRKQSLSVHRLIQNRNPIVDLTKVHSLKVYFPSFLRRLQAKNVLFKVHFCQNVDSKCWNCNKVIEADQLSCESCGSLQRPRANMTYFELLNVPQVFDINMEDVAVKYKKMQMLFHPDRFANKHEEELIISEKYSRLVNKAYSTLKDPFNRGMYLLAIRGINIDDKTSQLEPEFLSDVMDKNEELQRVDDMKSLEKVVKSNNKMLEHYVELASRAFQKEDLAAARDALARMKYFVNIDRKLKEKKLRFGIID